MTHETENCKVRGCSGIFRRGRRENGGTGTSGYCNAHYLRLKRHGTTEPAPRLTILERFWSRVDERGPDECWEWTSTLNNKGYGRFALSWTPEIRVLAHRFAYTLTTGDDLRGWVLMHTCDNPRCVNPAHLEPGTQADNVRDMWAKGRANPIGLAMRHAARKPKRKSA